MTEKAPILTDKETRRIENLTAPVAFDGLYDFVEEVCLSETAPLPPEQEPSTEAKVIAAMGIRGLRAAVDFTHGASIMSRDNHERFFQPDAPIKDPERFGDSLNTEAMRKTEALGSAMLKESFAVLGADAPEQVERYHAAMTDEEQMDVLRWLSIRLEAMRDSPTAASLQGDDDTFYHPVRLSPKIMGRYPEHTLQPTCLGLSILAASFLEQAGADVLHAGVMKTRLEQQREDAFSLFKGIEMHTEALYDLTLPHALEDSLQSAVGVMLRANIDDRGYHVAVYSRLKSGRWYQFDPNFAASGGIAHDEINQQLDNSHALLHELHESAPGLEHGLDFQAITMAYAARLMFVTGDKDQLGKLEDITSVLCEPEPESVTERIKTGFTKPFYERGEENGPIREAWDAFVSEKLYDQAFDKAFDKYVLWGLPLGDVLEKCRTDPEYCARRAEDIRLLPITMLVALAVDDINSGRDMPLHHAVEVGLPAPRIGSAVLNDFANFYGQDIPGGFRSSQWASLVPLTETISDIERTPTQKKMITDNLLWLFGALHYAKGDGIVVHTLSEQRRRQVEDVGTAR